MDRYVTDIKNGCYQNPVLPMDFSDPDAIRVGEDYYLISSSFTYLPGVPVLHSKDLVHWERIGNCVERLPFDRYAQPAHGCGTWAPALRYHAGRFYAFIPLPDEGIFYTEATDPAGPWSALHCVKSASGWIDPCPLWDDDGSVYMAHAFAKSRCGIKHKIQLSRLDPETLEVVEDGPIVFDGTLSQPTAEGPKMYKRNGWYYIFIPAGGVEYGWQTVLRARNVYGPYEEKIVMHQGTSSINGPHQGAWVTAPDGSDWFLHFQDRFELGRVVHLQPMYWHSDWPFIGLEQNGDGIGEPVTEWDCPKGEAGPGLQIGDSFTNGKPGLQWQWQANPQPEAWLRPVAGDALHLVCGASGSLWRQPNVLSQMLPAADFTANVTLGLAGCGAGAKVGLSVMGQKYSAIELCRTAQGCTVQLVQGMVKDLAPTGDAEETILAEKMVDTDEITVTMKITAAKQVQYALLAADGTAVPLGGAQPVAKATWTGARLALYARGGTKGCRAGTGSRTLHFSWLLWQNTADARGKKESKLAMASVTIRLNSIAEVKEFNRIAATVPGDVDLHSGRYCVDAKSIMGIFALNLARELTVDSPTLSEEELHKKFAAHAGWRIWKNCGQHRTTPPDGLHRPAAAARHLRCQNAR